MSVKTMQQLLNEIDEVKINVENAIRILKKIDNRPKKAAANRDRSVEGRTQINTLLEHINDLQKQLDIMTKESDPTWPIKTFDRTKQNALKKLSNLSKDLNQVDKRLEKTTGSIPPALPADTQPVVIPTASTGDENTKGVGALLHKLPFVNTNKTTTGQRTPSLSSSGDEDEEEEDTDEDVVIDPTKQPQSSSQVTKKPEISTDESEDDMSDDHQSLHEVQTKKLADDRRKDFSSSDRQSQTSTSSSSSPISKKPTVISTSTPLSHRRTSNPPQPKVIPTTNQDDDEEDDSYSDEEHEELKGLYESTEGTESVHSYSQEDEDEPTISNTHVQELQTGKYSPGTQFRVTHNLLGIQTGDLTIHKDDILILIEQPPDDDWWLFKNPQTQEQGMVPINHIELQSETHDQGSRHRVKPVTSPLILVNVFKANKSVPSGYAASNLASLVQHDEYKLFQTLIPKRTESNFAFTDLHWKYDTNQIHTQQIEYQKILTIKRCAKIPRIKGPQIRVLNRCVRICLYDGSEIISNIHSMRPDTNNIKEQDLTEDWYFVPNNEDPLIDEVSQLLIRTNEHHPSIIIELSQLCQSKVTHEKCEICCGWTIISFDDNQSSVISNTKNYNKLLHGGDFHEGKTLLTSQYKTLHSDGLSGKIDRCKKARIRFSLESREKQNDLLYNNLPLTSMIVPMNLVEILVFYRNELAYQLQTRYPVEGLSTRPLDSIFLSTFSQTLEQPDLIYRLRRLYHRKKDLTLHEQREKFLKIYESFIYPLLFYRKLPPYDFHSVRSINKRAKVIRNMIEQLRSKNNKKPNILATLLDPNLTGTWQPFTTNEICFSLQKYARDHTSKTILS